MAKKNKGAPTTGSANIKDQHNAKPKPQTKQEVSLKALLDAGKDGLNTLQARSIYGDTCLHSMVSDFRNKKGLVIFGKREIITNRAGAKSPFHRYWLTDESSVKSAKKLIDIWRIKRGALPLYKQPINENNEVA